MHYTFVATKNVLNLHAALRSLERRDFLSMPALGLIHGRTGSGKTTALASVVTQYDAVFVRAFVAITLSSLLDNLCSALKIPFRSGRNADKYSAICLALLEKPRTIFVDEADYLLHDQRMLECLRDIHDAAKVPVMLVGMEGFEGRISHRPQLYRRISQKVEFKPLDLEDTALVAASLCDIQFAPDLLEQIFKETKGSIGLVVVALSKLEAFAKGNRITLLDAESWGRKGILAGVA